MLTNIKRATSILEKKLKWLEGFFLLNQITYFKAFSNRMIEWFLKDYIKEANAISNYSIESNFLIYGKLKFTKQHCPRSKKF